MLSFNRRAFLTLSLAGLAGCGFTPAFAPGGAATRLQNSIRLDEPKSRADFLLVRNFEERLGPANPVRYGLSYSVALREAEIAISSENITTRYSILGNVTYALRDMNSDKVLISGRVENFTSYSASGTTVATVASQRDAEERLMVILTDQIITRLTADAANLTA